MIENRPPPLRAEASVSGDLPGAAAVPATRRLATARLPPRTRRAIREMASDDEETGPLRDWIAPLGLLAIGGVARFSQVLLYADGERLTRAKAVVLWLCELVLGGAAMLGGALAVAAMMGVNFGSPGRAVLKLMALWLVAAVAACFLAKLDAEPMSIRGILLAFHIVLLIYLFGVAWLFRLDLQESLLAAVCIAVLQGLLLFGVAQSMSPDAARAMFFG